MLNCTLCLLQSESNTMSNTDLNYAVEMLKQGHVIAYPTEAVWGLGCDPNQEQAFQKILNLKKRPIEKGVILLAEDIERIRHLLDPLEKSIQAQIIASWQPLKTQQRATTWLLPVSDAIPKWIYGQHDRVAIRVTQHPLCQNLCRAFDGLIVSTSANPAGLTPAKNAQQVRDYFQDQLYILDGALGQSPEPSRILDAVTGAIIRA